MKKTLLLLAVLFVAFKGVSYSQSNGYTIKFHIDGLKDTTVFLAYYYGENTYVKDTVQVNSTGSFYFEGKEHLPQGVYFLAIGKPRAFTRLFDFVIGQTQTFFLATDTANCIEHMKVSGDLDNKLFFENMLFNMDRNREVEPFVKTIRDSSLAEDQKRKARQEIKMVNEKVLAFQERIINQHPQTLTARILKANRPVQIPDPPSEKTEALTRLFS